MTEKNFTFKTLVLAMVLWIPIHTFAQLEGSLTSTENTNCSGQPCNYSGPSILINELMLSPNNNDGSIWGTDENRQGEWIELYNPDICLPVDISCYYLGNNAKDGDDYPGGYVIPPGTIIPPAGFALIRGEKADAVPQELLEENGGNVVELVVTTDKVCVGGGTRLWFPNKGGWFAFYDRDGVPQDAVSWGDQSNLDEYPCIPTYAGCNYSGPLANYNEFPNDRKNYILNQSAANFKGKSIQRHPDGGAWGGPDDPSYAICNSPCVDPYLALCTGTATVTPSGGVAPYTFLWDDSKSQTGATAHYLCEGEYCVTITDANGDTKTECVKVENVAYETEIEDEICKGQTYTLIDNTEVTLEDDYPIMLQSAKGCDSLIVTKLTVNPIYDIELNPKICHGTSYTLPDGAVVTVSDTYHVALQTQDGCDSLFTVNLTVKPPIEVTIDTLICEGNSYTLPNGNIVKDPDNYVVVMPGNATACDTTYTINLDFYPEFEIEAVTVKDITCHDSSDGEIMLNVNGNTPPYSYYWEEETESTHHRTGLDKGTYEVEVHDKHGCIENDQFEIKEPSPVEISATADELICYNSTTTLSAQASGGTGSFAYHWEHTASLLAVLIESPEEDTEYSVYASDSNGCETDTVYLEVAVINMYADSLDVSPHDSICLGNETAILAQYHGKYPPYTYTWNNSLPKNEGPHTVSPNNDFVYTVQVKDNCDNLITKSIPVTVIPLPEMEIGYLSDISCHGANDGKVEIQVSSVIPEFELLWPNNENYQTVGNNLSPGNYEVKIIDAMGCENDISFDIEEPDPVTISLTGDSLICIGNQTQLAAQSTGGTGAITFHWEHTSLTDANVQAQPETDRPFYVFAKDENGCVSDEAEFYVAVISMDQGSLAISSDTVICKGEPVMLWGDYSGNYGPYTYHWSHDTDANSASYQVSPTQPMVYNLVVKDICNNSVTDSVAINFFDQPVVELPNELLSECSPMELELYDDVNTDPGFIHEWKFNNELMYTGNPLNLTVTNPGVYLVTLVVTSPEGCVEESGNALPVVVNELPVADMDASKWNTGISEPDIVFTNTGSGYVNYSWLIENSWFEDLMQVSYAFPDTGSYDIHLFVENEFGCRDTSIRQIRVDVEYDIIIPNGFTPTNTGDNPYYDPTSTTNTVFYPFSEYVVDYEMNIFNRWGELVFISNEFEKGWNGTYREKPCPQDVYVYKIRLTYPDGNVVTKVGDVTLFR